MDIALNGLRTLVFRVIFVSLGQILAILTARWLGPQGKGLYTLAILYGTIGMTLMGGGAAAAAHEISRRGTDPRAAAANVSVLSLALGLVPAVAALIAWPWLGAHGWWWLLPVALVQPFALLNASLAGVFLGVDDIKRLNYAYVGPWAATLILFVAFSFMFGRTAKVALIAWAIGQSLATIYSIWLARRYWAPLAIRAVTSARLRHLISFSLQAGIANLVGFLNYRMDALMVEFYLGLRPLGIYSVGVNTAEGLWYFSQAISTASYARIGTLSTKESAELVARGMRHAVLIVGLLALFLLAIANPLLPLFYGSQYDQAVAPFRWLVPGITMYALAAILSAYYTNQLGKPHVAFLIAGFSMLINLGSCTILIPHFGLSGAAIASTLGYSIAISAGLVIFQRQTRISWRRLLIVNQSDLRDYLRFARQFMRLLLSATPVSPS